MYRFVKNNYKIFVGSFIAWFIVLILWNYFNDNYQITNKYLSKLSQDFVLTTSLGIITTIVGSLYNYQKNKTKQNQIEIENSKELFNINKNAALDALRRLEDLIDQQTFELRRIDDFEGNLKRIREKQEAFEQEIKDSIRMLENMMNSVQLELERQKEHSIQADRILGIVHVLRDDMKERDALKQEMREIIKERKSE